MFVVKFFLILMMGGESSEEYMNRHEEEVMRIRAMQDKNEQDAEIRKIALANNLKLGEGNIWKSNIRD